jgi:hypothetical protein
MGKLKLDHRKFVEHVLYLDFSCIDCSKKSLPELCEAIRKAALVQVRLRTFNDNSSHIIELKEITREKVKPE